MFVPHVPCKNSIELVLATMNLSFRSILFSAIALAGCAPEHSHSAALTSVDGGSTAAYPDYYDIVTLLGSHAMVPESTAPLFWTIDGCRWTISPLPLHAEFHSGDGGAVAN